MTHDTHPRSYTMWERLEPIARDEGLTDALRAAVADPLWMLTRQRQLGEFRGEDAGSPVRADVDYSHDRLNRVALGDGDAEPYDPTTDPPLATMVEREPVAVGDGADPDARTAVEAGMGFLDRYRDAIGDATAGDPPLPAPEDFPEAFLLDLDETMLDGEGRRFAAVLEGRALDGVEIYRTLARADGIVGADDRSDVDWSGWRAAEAWLPVAADRALDEPFKRAAVGYVEWYRDLYAEPATAAVGGGEEAWDDDRLSYAGSVAAGDPDNETVFDVDGHRGGRLDWHAFSVRSGSLSPAAGETETASFSRPPTRARFEGMPAPRFWELEDANVDLGSVSAAGEDLSRLLLLEFALVAGTDWFTLPLSAPVGSVTRITDLTVRDTFGIETTVEPTVERDDATDWGGFEFDLPGHDEPGLLLPPLVETTIDADPVEEVRFTRDEVANLVFGIETLVESPIGGRRDRSEFTQPTLSVVDITPGPPDEEYVAVRNDGDAPLDVTGWQLRADDTTVHTFGERDGAVVPPSETLTVYTGGDPAYDTDRVRHAGAGASVWADAEALSIHRPVVTDDGTREHRLVLTETVGETAPGTEQSYTLATDVPDHWVPLKPDPEGAESYRLEPAILLDADTLDDPDDALPTPQGRVLDPSIRLYEDEVTRAGTTVSRRYRYATWTDGRTYVWSGRRVSTGRGEASSGLRFDFTEPTTEAAPPGGRAPPAESEPITGTLADATPPSTGRPVSVVDYRVDTDSPSIQSPADEYVAIENTSGAILTLTGWQVEDAAGHGYEFPEGFELAPGDRVRVRTGTGTDTDRDLYWELDAYRWHDTADTITVRDDEGDVVASVDYPDLSALPAEPPLSVTDTAFDPPDDDRDALTEEYVTVENVAGEELDVSRWTVRDLADHAYRFPDGTRLDPGQSLTLRTGSGTDTDTEYYWGSERPIWNNDGDAVLIYDRGGSLVAATVVYGHEID